MTLKQSLQHTPHSRWPAFERHWAQRKGESDTQLLPLPSVRAAEAKKTSRRRSRRQRSKAKLCQAQASREVKIRVQGSWRRWITETTKQPGSQSGSRKSYTQGGRPTSKQTSPRQDQILVPNDLKPRQIRLIRPYTNCPPEAKGNPLKNKTSSRVSTIFVRETSDIRSNIIRRLDKGKGDNRNGLAVDLDIGPNWKRP